MTEEALRADRRPTTTGPVVDPSRSVQVDASTGELRMGELQRQVSDVTDCEQVYGAYLSLLYAAGATCQGEELPLRSANLDATSREGLDAAQRRQRLREAW